MAGIKILNLDYTPSLAEVLGACKHESNVPLLKRMDRVNFYLHVVEHLFDDENSFWCREKGNRPFSTCWVSSVWKLL